MFDNECILKGVQFFGGVSTTPSYPGLKETDRPSALHKSCLLDASKFVTKISVF